MVKKCRVFVVLGGIQIAWLPTLLNAADVQQSTRSGQPTPTPNSSRNVPSQRTKSGIGGVEDGNSPAGTSESPGVQYNSKGLFSSPQEGRSVGELRGEEVDVMEKDFNSFYRNVEKRFSNIVRKRHVFIHGDPYTIQGIPILYNSVSSGFNIGIRVAMFNVRRTDPYRAAMQLQYWESDRGKKNHRVRLDFPHVFDSEWRITFDLQILATVREVFSGIGQMGTPDFSQSDCPTNPNCINEFYDDFRKDMQVLRIEISRRIALTPFFVESAFQFQSTDVLRSAPGNTQKVFDVDRPFGVTGGKNSNFAFGFAYDTQDFEPYPTEGHRTELFATFYPRWIGNDFKYTRFSMSDRMFIPLRSQIVLAHFMGIDAIVGDAPFYDLGLIGGGDPRDVSGGLHAMRGYSGNRFLGHYKWIQQVELRYEFGRANWWRQRFDFSFVPHMDLTRVWDKNQKIVFNNFAISGGWGFRARWNKNFLMRADFGFSRESRLLQLGFGNAF